MIQLHAKCQEIFWTALTFNQYDPLEFITHLENPLALSKDLHTELAGELE
jgi:hypothetical protein